ncbi:topology modulation protein [Embleya sp. AB8]|uniref:topology modulation protein n=1 Tax=Embleya sp. AB8 TaxID=3156304 RepID=UPI003C761A4E
MHKIVVVGVGETGRTGLADALGSRLGLPVTHLDTLYHREDRSTAPAEEFADAQRALVAGPGWILAGNYAATLAIRLVAADTVVFLDMNPTAAVTGILARRRHPEPGDHDRLNQGVLRPVLAYRHAVRPRVRRLIAEHAGPDTAVHVFTTRRAADRWLAGLPAAS